MLAPPAQTVAGEGEEDEDSDEDPRYSPDEEDLILDAPEATAQDLEGADLRHQNCRVCPRTGSAVMFPAACHAAVAMFRRCSRSSMSALSINMCEWAHGITPSGQCGQWNDALLLLVSIVTQRHFRPHAGVLHGLEAHEKANAAEPPPGSVMVTLHTFQKRSLGYAA